MNVTIAYAYGVPVAGKLEIIFELVGTVAVGSLVQGHQNTHEGGRREGKVVAIEHRMVVHEAVGQFIGELHHQLGAT